MIKRKIYDELLDWKNTSDGKTAVMLDGARRVGKSYIAEAFAKNEYRSYILIDFSKTNADVRDVFVNNLENLDDFFMYLSGYYNTKLYEGDTLFIFDEVQTFPRAREAIKHLVADGRYHYLETGSLMSIKENVSDIVIPSEERHLNMYPIDFSEFATALGEEPMLTWIEKCFKEDKAMGQAMHRKAMTLFRKYMIVGGMPQAVQCYIDTNDFEEVDKVKRDILNLYRQDIVKYAGKYSVKVESIFDDIPAQLSKHETKFRLSSLGRGSRYRDYEDSFFWLNDSRVVNIAYNTKEPNVGLRLNRDRVTLKCYMADTGLLISHAFDENGLISEEIYKKILYDKIDVNMGMLVENVVSQMLTSSGHKLYFYSKSSKDSDKRMEIDFLISKRRITSRHNISPIEVKSGKNYTLSSLRKYISHFQEFTDVGYVIHQGDLKNEDGIKYLPIYMTQLI